jgi:cytoplasmic iron level regulating protein YaaA (DUF328/UPF0246 family)
MILLISPAKTLDFSITNQGEYSHIRMPGDTEYLAGELRQYSVERLMKLMNISEKLATLNKERYDHFSPSYTPDNSRQAVMAFKGDVYTGLNAEDFEEQELQFAQQHLRILSGLYGLLRPMDLIQPYRLEMGTTLNNIKGKNLYEYWGSRITDMINDDLETLPSKVVVNLASNEYFKAVKTKQLKGKLIHISFKENRDGKYKIISFYAKKARGMMARYAIINQITDPLDLRGFSEDDYAFNELLSEDNHWVFTR